jgi:hypothetical protein
VLAEALGTGTMFARPLVEAFVVAQLLGAALGLASLTLLFPPSPEPAVEPVPLSRESP